MKKIYFLSTCNTCKKIIKELNLNEKGFETQDIKTETINEKQLNEMHHLAGTYESLFTRRSMKYRSMNLKEKELNELDYKNLILQEYTFLKRPVIIVNDKIFIGNSKKNIESLASLI